MNAHRAVVTGGARGLGLSIASLLVDRGHSVLLVDRDESVIDTAKHLASQGHDVDACVADLTVEEDLGRLAGVVADAGGVSVLVNNAGVTRDARLLKMAPSDFAAVLEVNLLGPMRLSYALEDVFVEGASIINMSSRAALGNFGQTNYVASKSGLIGFTRSLALAWSPRVRVNAVAPGLIDSAMSRAMPENVLDGLVAKVPLGRIGEPDDVARAVAFLASEESSYVTGQVLTVCGGRSIAV